MAQELTSKGFETFYYNSKKYGELDFVIEQAFVFSQGNVEVVDKRVYLPIYMVMFLKKDTLDNGIYKLDLSGLTIH